MSNIKSFNPSSENITDLKLLIKKQGEIVCQDQLTIETIKHEIDEFDFGYISYSIKARSGTRSPRNFSDKYILNGFIVCSIIDDDEAIIKLICSRKHNKIEKELMDETEFYLREIGITKITLYSLSYIKLKKWYESLEYKHISDINIHQDGKQLTKVHIMRKKL